MIRPDNARVKSFIASANVRDLAKSMLLSNPWYFDRIGVDFGKWSMSIRTKCGFTGPSSLALVGSGATGFSLHPEKAGTPFRDRNDKDGASDLDIALIDPAVFIAAWDSLLKEDAMRTGRRIADEIRIRVYWGRIEQDVLPAKLRPRIRKLASAISRDSNCNGHSVTIRLYRRREDLMGYTTWSLGQLKRDVGI